MAWVKYEEGTYPDPGWYQVVVSYPGTAGVGMFSGCAPTKNIQYMQYKKHLKLKKEFEDRVEYEKCYSFFDFNGLQFLAGDILYWYELDPIPQDER